MRGRYIGIVAASALLTLPGLGAASAAPAVTASSGIAIVTEPGDQPPQNTDPYIVECQDNGMALWSDGTTSYSEWCMNNQQQRDDEPGGPVEPMIPGVPFGPKLPFP